MPIAIDERMELLTCERATIDERDSSRVRPRTVEVDVRYRIGSTLGRGGMGEVLAATDRQLGREVAIKRLHSTVPTEGQRLRFLREPRVQGRLDHPAIVPVHELGTDASGQPYFVMKKLAGTTLSAMLRAGDAPRQRLLRAFADVCLAIEYAHVHGVIHRDIKPENILLGEYGEVYVLDWGVAKVDGETDEFADLLADGGGTQVGAVVGTAAFMSPEQAADSRNVDARTDVYALGRVLAEILVVDADPQPELLAISDAATAWMRESRTPSARELGAQVQRFLDGDRDLAQRRRLAREQLAEAQFAFSAGLDDVDRSVVFRSASSAMALDPTLTGAAELVGRLMIEPPRSVPRDVKRANAADDEAYMRAQARAATRVIEIGVTITVVTLLVMHQIVAAVAFSAIGLANIYRVWRLQTSARTGPPWAVVIGNALMVMVMARLFSPILIAPAVAGVTLVSLASNPFLVKRSHIAWLVLAFGGAIILPELAEQLGIVACTMEPTRDGLVIRALAGMAPALQVPFLVVFGGGLLGCATYLGRASRSHERAMRHQLHLQAWQLRQLVSDPQPVSA